MDRQEQPGKVRRAFERRAPKFGRAGPHNRLLVYDITASPFTQHVSDRGAKWCPSAPKHPPAARSRLSLLRLASVRLRLGRRSAWSGWRDSASPCARVELPSTSVNRATARARPVRPLWALPPPAASAPGPRPLLWCSLVLSCSSEARGCSCGLLAPCSERRPR